MTLPRITRRARSASFIAEALEDRRLLSATLLSQIAVQNVQSSQGGMPINLATYFNDPTITGTAIQMQTPLGNIPFLLTDSATPQTVANFVHYINSGEYANTVIHRSVPGFVIQGGGYTPDGNHITTFGNVPGESATETLHNTTGTIAMALSSGPNSGTSEWFVNLAANSILDGTADGGPFTVFGRVIYNGMNVVDAIASLPVINADVQNANLGLSQAWQTIPVHNYSGPPTATAPVPTSSLVTNNTTIVPHGLVYTVQSSNPNLVTGSVANGVLTLTGGINSGTANVTVTATDLGGGVASSTFAVNVTGGPPPTTVATVTTIAPSSPAVVVNGSDTFTATVIPAAPGVTPIGSVTLYSRVNGSDTAIGTAPLVGNVATFPVSLTTQGAETFTAVYSGGTGFSPSTAAPVTVNVTAPPVLEPVVGANTIPSQVVAGKTVHGVTTVNVTNATGATEKGLATVSLYASTDGLIDASSVLVATQKRRLSLKAGKGAAFRLSTKALPATLANGTYTLLARTTDPAGKTTDSTSGPSIHVSAAFVSLAISGVVVKPGAIKIGRAGNLTLTLANNGNTDSSGPATIQLGLSSDGRNETTPLSNLTRTFKIKAGHSMTLHLRFAVSKTASAGSAAPFVSVTQNASEATALGVAPITLIA